MEFNARYLLMSLFALVVILGGFLFVYWLNNGVGFGQRSEYQVRFSVPVSGLANGSNVLFNGVKVGEVTRVVIDPADPSALTAVISVNPDVPMRTDTIASVDFQGLTGAANILLAGQSSDAPELKGENGNPPVLVADPANSRSWTQNAGRVLGNLDKMLAGDNNRLDKILAGLERMVGGDDTGEKGLYDLAAPTWPDRDMSASEWQLVISEPTVLLALNTARVLELKNPNQWGFVGTAEWTDNLPNLVQTKIIQGLENAGYSRSVIRPADAFDAPLKLSLDIRKLHYRSFDQPAAIIDIVAKIMDGDGQVLADRRFQEERSISSAEEVEVVGQMGELFTTVSRDLIDWAVEFMEAN